MAGGVRADPALDEKDYPSREALLETKPDLVLASYSSAFEDKAVGTHESFDTLGIATYVSPFACKDKSTRPAVSWDSIATEITDYGTLFGARPTPTPSSRRCARR